MEGHRIFCNEITLPFLEKVEGRGYLRLLKHFMVEDPTSLSKAPIYISNPRWDQLLPNNSGNKPSEKELVSKAYYDGIRNTFICVPRNHLICIKTSTYLQQVISSSTRYSRFMDSPRPG